jgi:hypothetical protein
LTIGFLKKKKRNWLGKEERKEERKKKKGKFEAESLYRARNGTAGRAIIPRQSFSRSDHLSREEKRGR